MKRLVSLKDHPSIEGYDFEQEFDFDKFIDSFYTTAFQASHLARGIDIINQMIESKATIMMSFTANAISSGIREIIKFLVKHKYVSAITTTAGGIEEDVIKTLKPFKLGSFEAPGEVLFNSGVGRIGNIFVPNDRYLYFERFMNPFFNKIYKMEKASGKPLTPSNFTYELGKYINDESSYLYWAAKNNIPVFCPGLTDGAIGDLFYFQKRRVPDFYIDIVGDHKKIVDFIFAQEKIGAIILGGGIAKHYLLNANIFREGVDFAVYITTAQEFDGSDSGGNEEEAKTWAKIKCNAPTIKIKSEITLAFPLIVAATFAKDFHSKQKKKQNNR